MISGCAAPGWRDPAAGTLKPGPCGCRSAVHPNEPTARGCLNCTLRVPRVSWRRSGDNQPYPRALRGGGRNQRRTWTAGGEGGSGSWPGSAGTHRSGGGPGGRGSRWLGSTAASFATPRPFSVGLWATPSQ